MRVPAPLAAMLLLPALLTGCGGGGDSDTAAPSGSASVSTSASPSTSATASATPSPSTSSSDDLAALSAEEILARAKDAALQAKGVHVKGSYVEGGETVAIDLRLAGEAGATGSLANGGQRVQLLRIGRVAYFKADKSFWTDVDPKSASVLAGKYVKVDADSKQFAELASLTDAEDLFDENLEPSGDISKGPSTTIDGTKVVSIVDDDPEEGGTLYIAADGTPYPLRVTPKDGNGTINFTEWDTPVRLSPPPAAEVFDLTAITGK